MGPNPGLSLAGDSLQLPGPSCRAQATPCTGNAVHICLCTGPLVVHPMWASSGEKWALEEASRSLGRGFAQPQEASLEVGTSSSEHGNELWQDTLTAHSSEPPGTRPGSGWHLQLWLSGVVTGWCTWQDSPCHSCSAPEGPFPRPLPEKPLWRNGGLWAGPGQLGTETI